MIDVGAIYYIVFPKGTFSTGPGLKDRESFYPGNFLVLYRKGLFILFVQDFGQKQMSEGQDLGEC